MVIGNLFAIRQTNMKRLLAFSSIVQVGFILVGMSGSSLEGETSVIYFILVYVFSNLGAFGVISVISSNTGKEIVDDYLGMYQTNPFLTWVLAISLFSLAGIPPAAGFFAKFFLLLAGAGTGNYILIVIAALNMVVALYYYLFVVKLMFVGKNENPMPVIKTHGIPLSGLIICLAGILITGIYGGVYSFIYSIVK
jgi:NADH-quinone oxidoreductase subunit N